MYCDGKLIVYEVDRGAAGVSLGVYNKFPNSLMVAVDCSDSENVQSHLGKMHTDVRVAAGECAVAHHLAPLVPEDRWSWTFSLNAKMAAS